MLKTVSNTFLLNCSIVTSIHQYHKTPQKLFYSFYFPLKLQGLSSTPPSSTNPCCTTEHYFIFLRLFPSLLSVVLIYIHYADKETF